MKIIFMGTPEYAVPSLRKLVESHHEVVAVVTQPDRLRNHNKLSFSPVKEEALKYGIPVLQYEKIRKEGIEDLRNIEADAIVTVAYGQILSSEILEMKKYGVINSHASLLPKYRGSSPIQWAVINGEKTTGITIMKTALSVDSGDMILQKPVDILPNETSGELFDRLSEISGGVLLEALDMIEEGKATFTPQDETLATHFPMLKKEDGRIDFNRNAEELIHFVYGMSPWPSAFTFIGDIQFKIHEIDKITLENESLDNYSNGEIVYADCKKGLVVKVNDGFILLKVIQPQNSKRMECFDYLRGHKIEKQIIK